MTTQHYIRQASSALDDGKRILDFSDSQLPWLTSIGSGTQWGSASLSSNEEMQDKYRKLVERGEAHESSWGKDWIRVFILEVEIEESAPLTGSHHHTTLVGDSQIKARSRVPVAAMILEGCSASYTRAVLPEQDVKDPFVYVRYLVSDRRLGASSKDAGKALLDHADKVASLLAINRLCLDCWNGNNRKLVRYYEGQGFYQIGDVEDSDGWPASVLERKPILSHSLLQQVDMSIDLV